VVLNSPKTTVAEVGRSLRPVSVQAPACITMTVTIVTHHQIEQAGDDLALQVRGGTV
jgi:hypothetical protein